MQARNGGCRCGHRNGHERHTIRTSYARKSVVRPFAGTAIAVATAGPASAATQTQNGLVDVAVGDITIQDVNVGVAAQIAAAVCGVDVGPVAVLGTAVDATGVTRTVCTTPQRPVTISQA